MTVLSRRIGAFTASVWLVFWLTIVPFQSAQAFVWSPGLGIKFPPPPGAPAPINLLPIANPWGAAITAIGTIVLAVCIQNGQWVCVKPSDAAPDQLSIIPPGDGGTSYPAMVRYNVGDFANQPANGWPTHVAACDDGYQANGVNGLAHYCSSSTTSCVISSVSTGSCTEGQYTFPIQTLYVCLAGGTLSQGGLCVDAPPCPAGTVRNSSGSCVAAAPVYVSDGSPTLRASGGGTQGWVSVAADPDAPPSTVPVPITATGTDANGNPTQEVVTPLSDGGLKVQHIVQNQTNSNNNSNNTTTTTTTVVINNAGSVVNSTTVTNYGGIDSQAGPAPGAVNIQLPTDYNREPTQQAIQTDIALMKDKQAAIADELEGKNAPAVPAAPDFSQIEGKQQELEDAIGNVPDGFSDSKTNWFSWVWTPPFGTCELGQGTLHGYSVNWDICPWVDRFRELAGWLFAVFGAWSIYNELFRRESDA